MEVLFTDAGGDSTNQTLSPLLMGRVLFAKCDTNTNLFRETQHVLSNIRAAGPIT